MFFGLGLVLGFGSFCGLVCFRNYFYALRYRFCGLVYPVINIKAYLTMLSYMDVCGWPPSNFFMYSRVTWFCYTWLCWCSARHSLRGFFSCVGSTLSNSWEGNSVPGQLLW